MSKTKLISSLKAVQRTKDKEQKIYGSLRQGNALIAGPAAVLNLNIQKERFDHGKVTSRSKEAEKWTV